jgi:hypothetical protein
MKVIGGLACLLSEIGQAVSIECIFVFPRTLKVLFMDTFLFVVWLINVREMLTRALRAFVKKLNVEI